MFSNFSDLMDQAVVKQTAEKNVLLISLRSCPNCFFQLDDPEVLSILNGLVQNPNCSVESFRWFVVGILGGY